MNKLNKLYREFFGLTEADNKTSMFSVSGEDVANMEKMAAAALKVKSALGENEQMVDEAQLINHMTDYKGGVEYVLRDPSEAQSVSDEIRQWAEKKGFTVVKQTTSASGKVGYFYFRLGQDPALESQKIQGYIAQKPEVKHFRFNIKGQKQAPAEPQIEPQPQPARRIQPEQ
jgi:soluble cytochrome b562